MTHKITFDRLKSIITEEIQSALNEDKDKSPVKKKASDHEMYRKSGEMSITISEFLDSVATFEDKIGINVTNALTPHLQKVKEVLIMIAKDPSKYLDKAPREPLVFKMSKPEK
jgi:hypothetical protein